VRTSFTHDRRRINRQPPHGERSRHELVLMIAGMYREMPGLCLYLHQAARLFGLPNETCRIVLDDLVASGQLYRKLDGQYAAS
jgi:hypothetical protein